MVQEHSITWGALQLDGSASEAPYRLDAMADGTNFGNPEPLLEVVKSLLADGSLAVLQSWDNREVPIRLRISAPDELAGPALAAAEAALMAEILAESKSPLVWVPAASGSVPCVFDVVAATLQRDTSAGWDIGERREHRFYLLTLTCLPFARSQESVVVPALPITPVTETKFTVDTCSALTGWTSTAHGFGTVTRRNLVPNPSFETGTSDWFASDSIGTQSGAGWIGSAAGSFEGWEDGGTDAEALIHTGQMSVTAGNHYTASAYLRRANADKDSVTASLKIQWLNSAGALVGEHSTSVVTLSHTAFTRFARTATAPSSATKARIVINGTFSAFPLGAVTPVLVDGVLFEQAATSTSPADTFFDGSTTDAPPTYYNWFGTAHASASTASTLPAATTTSGRIDLGGNVTAGGTRTLTLTRTGAVTMTSTPYLRVSVATTFTGGTGSVAFKVGTGTASPISPTVVRPSALGTGILDYYLQVGDFDTLVIEVSSSSTGLTAGTLQVHEIERTDTITTLSTKRQQSRLATVLGSAPTQAAIRLYDATPGALGTDILVYTTRDTAWQPNLRESYLVSSAAVTADTARVSGARNTLASAMVFRIPASVLTTGTYALVALMTNSVSGTLTWTAKMVSSSGASTVGSSITSTGSVTVPVLASYSAVPLGNVTLPVVVTEGTQMVELTLTGTSNMSIDDVWPFNLDRGAVTRLKDSDSLTWIEIRSPELGAERHSVFGGTGAKGNQPVCVDWKCESFGVHRFDPGVMQVFTVTSTSLNSQSELEFYQRDHSHIEGGTA